MLHRAETQFEFGPCRLVPGRRALHAHGQAVPIHGRAFDLLAVLVENRDRVVSRDELMATVWAGTTVSDSNIAVQMAGLRRLLPSLGVDSRSIVTVPGRGYQFVAAVEMRLGEKGGGETPPVALNSGEVIAVALDAPGAEAPISDAPIMDAMGPATAARPWGRPALVACALACVAASLALAWVLAWPWGAPRAEDDRLTIGFRPFEAVGPAPAASLAIAYTDAIRTHPRRYGDIRFYEAEWASPGRAFHFRLSGTVQVIGSAAQLSYTVVDRAGELVARDHRLVPLAPSPHDLDTAASALLEKISPDIFQAEAQARSGPPRDAIDFLVQSKADCPEDGTPAQIARAIGDDEAALRRAPALFPARLWMAALLNERLPLRPASEGDGDGERALAIVDGLLDQDPGNLVAIQIKAATLVEMGRAAEAELVVRHGLALDPDDPTLRGTLLDAYEEAGQLAEADALVARDPLLAESPTLSQLYFAEGHDARAIEVLDPYLSNEPVEIERRLMLLLKAASLVRLDRVPEATALVRDALSGLPPALRRQAGLRRSFYELPQGAWAAFQAALTQAGMPA